MQKFILPLILLFGASLLISACSGDDGDKSTDPTPDPIIRLVAAAHIDPLIQEPDSAWKADVWDTITGIAIPTGTQASYNSTGFFTTGKTVEMKALVADDSLLYIWAKWNDNDQDNRYGQMQATWTNNKFQFTEKHASDTFFFNEDRFAIMFDNGGTDGADCVSYCHDPADTSSAGKRFYGVGATDADMWLWKAHRTGLANLSEDMHVSALAIDPDAQDSPGDDLYFRNFDTTFTNKPKSMHADSTEYTGPGLLESETQGQIFDTFDLNLIWGEFPLNQPPVGFFLPGLLILDNTGHDGSRWDVQTWSTHDGTHWTTVFRRNVTPTDGTDQSFVGGDSVSVSIAVGDADDRGKFVGREPFYLVFE